MMQRFHGIDLLGLGFNPSNPFGDSFKSIQRESLRDVTVTLSTLSSRYEHAFKPIDQVTLTKGQEQKAQENGVTHVCMFDGPEPKWLVGAATKAGFKAVCLGYTRHKRHGFVVKEVWGLTKEQP